jgi:hypothetical protein
LSFHEGVGVLKIEGLESGVLKIEASESELLCTNSTALISITAEKSIKGKVETKKEMLLYTYI